MNKKIGAVLIFVGLILFIVACCLPPVVEVNRRMYASVIELYTWKEWSLFLVACVTYGVGIIFTNSKK